MSYDTSTIRILDADPERVVSVTVGEHPLDEYDNPDVKPDNEWRYCPYCGRRIEDGDTK